MRNAPALRDRVRKQLRQFFGCLCGDGISPGAERNQKFSCLIKYHVTVHHGTDANTANCM